MLAFTSPACPHPGNHVPPPTHTQTNTDTTNTHITHPPEGRNPSLGRVLRVRALVDSASAGYFAWRQLSLQFDVPPPLHLVITQQALEAYNALFQFFLVVSAHLAVAEDA